MVMYPETKTMDDMDSYTEGVYIFMVPSDSVNGCSVS